MPAAPLPPALRAFLAGPRRAVVGTVRDDGSPVTTACWYGLQDDGRILLSMDRDSHRLPLTVLGDDWYNQLSLLGQAVEIREDQKLADIDALSHRYLGEPYEDRSYNGMSVLVEVERWHTWGDPAGEAA